MSESAPLFTSKPAYEAGQVGPIDNRRCRDVLFLALFCAFWVGMFVVAARGFAEGDPERLLHGQDMEGALCGVGAQADFPYLYWLDPLTEENYGLQVCVEACPDSTPVSPDPIAVADVVCRYGVDPTPDTVADLVDNAQCFFKYKATSVLYRCVPLECPLTGKDGDLCKEAVDDDLHGGAQGVNRLFRDLERSWEVIVASAFIALAVGFLWLFLLRLFAAAMVWVTLLATVAGCVAMTMALYIKAGTIDPVDGLPVDPSSENREALEIFAYVATVLTLILVCVIVFMARRISFAIGIIKESSKAVAAMPLLVFFPVVPFVMVSCVFIYWLIVSFWLVSAGDWNEDEETFDMDDTLREMLVYHFFGLLWTVAFIIAISHTTIAGAVASWYWTHDKRNMPASPIWSSFKRVLRYHLGSLAFGSLILAIVQFVRAIMEYVDKKAREAGDNSPIRYVLCCVRCCLACFERFIKFLNKNAYIMIAVYGDSFCSSAQRAFELILRNVLRVAAISLISDFLIFLGKIFIASGTSFVAFLILSSGEEGTDDTVESPLYPTVLVFFIAYVIGSAALDIYEMAISTILLCFCEDCERNDGSPDRPYYFSEALGEYVHSTSQK